MHLKRVYYVSIAIIIFFGIVACKWRPQVLKVAISPYQDIAMIVNINNLNLDKRFGTKVSLINMPWEDILPAIASAGTTADIGFGSLAEYLTKVNNLNRDTSDPILFLYPAYIFKGGGFITYRKDIPRLTAENITDSNIASSLLRMKIGAQKNSIYEMVIFTLAKRSNFKLNDLRITDIPLNDGALAIQSGSLDVTAAGLTQISEALRNGGKIVLTMDDLGFADITGFICKKSIYAKRKVDIENLLRMWFLCADYVMSDIDKNSKYSRDYLDKSAATKYTLQQYKSALSQEYFPTSIKEVDKVIMSDEGKFSYKRISNEMIEYLYTNRIVKARPMVPDFIRLK